MRTQEEILERFKEVDDLFGVQKIDLISYMEFEYAKPYLKDEYVNKVETGEEEWNPSTDPKEDIVNYLDFAYDKAKNKRGLSAGRNMLHFKTWIWLDDDKFYNEIIDSINNYTNYGIPTLNKISEYYNYDRDSS